MSGKTPEVASGKGDAARPRRHPHDRPWRSVVFAPVGDGATRRRGSDGLRLVLAALAILCCWLISGTPASAQLAILHFLTPAPNGVQWLVSAVWWLGSIGAIAALGVLALLSRRRNVARDILIAGLVAWVASLVMELIIGSNGGHTPSPTLNGIALGFPIARIAATAAVITASLPYLSRGFQRVVEVVLVLAAVATIVNGSGLPISVLASLAIGWGVAAAVHLGFGSPLGLPSGGEVTALLADLGIEARDLIADPDQVWGVARFRGADEVGPLRVSVYGRDAHDAQLLAKLLRFVAYRDSGPTLTLTRVQQVEHEAYLTLMAERSGARVPGVLKAGTAGPARDAVLVTRPPGGAVLADVLPPPPPPPSPAGSPDATTPEGAAVSEGAVAVDSEPAAAASTVPVAEVEPEDVPGGLTEAGAADLFVQVLALRKDRITHGAIGPATVIVGAEGSTGLVDFRSATASGTEERMDRDVAASLATVALAIGAERAVTAAAQVVPTDQLAASLPFLQRAAMGRELSRTLRGKKALLAALRAKGAEAAGVEVPKLAEPRRISWVTLILVLGTLIGGWALIGVLVNVSESWSTITGAAWGWVVATFVLAQLAYPSLAITTTGSIVDPLPYGRVVALEVANSFVSLAGGTMGVLATRVRFFQQDGYDATMAVSSGVVISTVSWIVKGALFLIALPFALSSLHFTKKPTGGTHTGLVWFIILIVIGVAVLLGLVLFVPRLRRLAGDKLRPKVSEVWSHLRSLSSHPKNMVEIFGGSILAQLLIAFALGTALHAFNQHLPIATLLVVLTLASMIGGMSPVPGGMGVVEAGMILCLTAAGIPQTDAVAATFVQRLFTSYLPPIWGWFVLIWLRKKEYL